MIRGLLLLPILVGLLQLLWGSLNGQTKKLIAIQRNMHKNG